MVNEVRCQNTILFIDELHTLVGVYGAEGHRRLQRPQARPLARGEIQMHAPPPWTSTASTSKRSRALERRFQQIIVNPRAMKPWNHGRGDRYEAHHRVQIKDEALGIRRRIVRPLHHRGAFSARQGHRRHRRSRCAYPPQGHDPPPDLKELDAQIEQLNQEKEIGRRRAGF